jgi:hypothetical protein
MKSEVRSKLVLKSFGNPRIEKMNGRLVVVQNYEDIPIDQAAHFQDCVDCHAPTTLIITELLPTNTPPRIYGWCGKCNPGH